MATKFTTRIIDGQWVIYRQTPGHPPRRFGLEAHLEAIVQGLGQDPALRSPEAERESANKEWELHSNWVIQVREQQRGNKPPSTKEVK